MSPESPVSPAPRGAAQLVQRELSPRAIAQLLADEPDATIAAARGRINDGRAFVRRNAALALSLLDPIDDASLAKLDVARKDEDAIVRRHAISGFSPRSVEPARALPVLLGALDDDDEGVLHLATDGLERHLVKARAPTFKLMIELLAESSFAILIRATEVFKNVGDRAIVPLTATISHHNGFIRRWARETLQSFGGRAVPVLIDALKRSHLRAPAARTLEGMTAFDEDHINRLAQLTGGDDPLTQAAAFRVLTHVQKVLARRTQRLAQVPHPEFYARPLGVEQLKRATEGVTADALLWNLRDGRWFVRANSVALTALVVRDKDSRTPLACGLAPLTRDTDWRVRLAVAHAAVTILGQRATPLLIEAADDAKADVADEARRQLVAIAKQTVAPLIRALERAESGATLHHAVTALVAAGSEALPMLCEAISSAPSTPGRVGAIEALVALGGRGERERRALIEALEHRDERVRAAAAKALGQLVRGDEAVLEALRAHVGRERSLPVRRAAARSVDLVAGKLPKPKTLAPPPLPTPDFGDTLLTREALAPLAERLTADALRPLLGAGSAIVRHNVALALSIDEAHADDHELVRWLLISLKDSDERVRLGATAALAALRPPPSITVPALSAALYQAEGPFERALVDAHLAYGRGALGPMLEALSRRRFVVGGDLDAIAAQISDELTLPLAEHLFRPATYSVRRLAADLLAAMGPRAARAWPQLSRALQDPLGRLRVKVVRAIGRCAEPSVDVYEELLIIGNYDSRGSVRSAIEAAIEALIRRIDPVLLEEAGGVEGQKLAWLATIEEPQARIARD